MNTPLSQKNSQSDTPLTVCVVTGTSPSSDVPEYLSFISPSEAAIGLPQNSVIIVDTRDMNGLVSALISHLIALNFDGIVLLMTPYSSIPIWMRDRRTPIRPPDNQSMTDTVEWLIETVLPLYVELTGRPFEKPQFPAFVGISPQVDHIRDLLPRIAEHDRAPVLILGSSGTGKQVVARGIHDHGPRGTESFVEVNCTALPDTLLESELFGRERGAYTDAHTARQGLVETANDGTLFLDEIGHMSEKLQMALLKVIEQRTYRRVGGNDERNSNARFLAATSRDLEDAIAAGEFRGDLLYRLNVFTIRLPDLAQRDADVLLLGFHYAKQYAEDYGRNMVGLTGDAAAMLLQHNWPGNVRELKNISERSVVLHDGNWLDGDALLIDGHSSPYEPDLSAVGAPAVQTDDAIHIDASGAIRVNVPPWGLSLSAVERAVIEAALRSTGNNISKTAKLLFISRDTLRYRLKKHGIDDPKDG
jgi:two-component system, NtrC family, response regulator AtoC